MNTTKRIKIDRWLSGLFLGLFLLMLYGCNSGVGSEDSTNESKATTQLPSELQKLTLSGGVLSAYVTIDGDVENRVEMDINPAGSGSASSSIAGLSFSAHTIMISYEYTIGVTTYILATAIRNIDLISGSADLNFFANDYDLDSYDDDRDGTNNAEALVAGFDPGGRIDTSAPIFNSGSSISVEEGAIATGYTAQATDDSGSVSYSLVGGVDELQFNIDSNTGALSFKSIANYEAPDDSDANNTYVVGILATDGDNPVAISVTVSVTDGPDQAPIAIAGSNQTAPLNATVNLDGNQSSSADGSPLTYLWSFVTIPADSSAVLSGATTETPSFTVDSSSVNADYIVQLIVNDGENDSAPHSIIISTGNTAPVANAGRDQSKFTNRTVTLDGSGSFDVNGDSFTYSWKLTLRPRGSTAALSSSNAEKPTFVADVDGKYTASLQVNDGRGGKDIDTVTVRASTLELVLPPPLLPPPLPPVIILPPPPPPPGIIAP